MKFTETFKEYPFTYFLLVTTVTTVVIVIHVFDFLHILYGSMPWKMFSLIVFATLIYLGVYKEVWK